MSDPRATTARALDRYGRPVGVWAAYALLCGLPRISGLLANPLYRDDFVHTPYGHLESYRLLNWLELAFWQAVAGPEYLTSNLPKLVGAGYAGFLCLALRSALMRWGASSLAATLLPSVFLFGTVTSSLVLWNVTVVYVLSLSLIVAGYAGLSRDGGPRAWLLCTVVMALGITGYQVHVGLLPALLFAELYLRRGVGRAGPWLRKRLLSCAAAVVLAALSVVALNAAGVEGWEGRGLAGAQSVLDDAGTRLRLAANNLGAVTTPVISYYFGTPRAWSFWWLPYVAASAVTAGAYVTRARYTGMGLVACLAPLALPVAAAAVVIPLNWIPTGPRVSGAIWLSFVLSFLPLLGKSPGGDSPQKSRGGRGPAPWVAAGSTVVFCVLSFGPLQLEQSYRIQGWREDRAVVERLEGYWAAQGHKPSDVRVEVCLDAASGIPAPTLGAGTLVVQDLRELNVTSYANLVSGEGCPTCPLAQAGFRVDERSEPCAAMPEIAFHGAGLVVDDSSPLCVLVHEPGAARTTVRLRYGHLPAAPSWIRTPSKSAGTTTGETTTGIGPSAGAGV